MIHTVTDLNIAYNNKLDTYKQQQDVFLDRKYKDFDEKEKMVLSDIPSFAKEKHLFNTII